MRTSCLWMAAAVCAALLAGPARAGMIGIDLVGKYTDPLDPGDEAGAVRQAHWNACEGEVASCASLVDETGALTGVSASWRGRWDYNGLSDKTPDSRLMRGGLTSLGDQPLRIEVAGLDAYFPGPHYDVLVYFDCLTADVIRTLSIGSATAAAQGRMDTGFDGAYVENTGAGGNYVRFRGLTDDAFVLEAAPGSELAKSAMVTAIQIASAPEPATLALAAVGLAAVLARRRR